MTPVLGTIVVVENHYVLNILSASVALTMTTVLATIVAVEKHYVLNILSVCL
jgi:hypothetical protein